MSVHGVQLPVSALRSLSTCLVIRLAAVDTGLTVSLGWAVTPTLTIVHGGLTVARVCSTSCVDGARSLTILPSASVTAAISPVLVCFICVRVM